jgi:hypothetical protein
MAIANIYDAKLQLSKVGEQAMNGEEVTLAKTGSTDGPAGADSYRLLGSCWGAVERRVRITDDSTPPARRRRRCLWHLSRMMLSIDT